MAPANVQITMAPGSLEVEDTSSPEPRVRHSRPLLPTTHPTAAIYLDESGVVKTDRFFGIGCLKAIDGPALTRALRKSRQALSCVEELHWSHFNKADSRESRSFQMALAAIDVFFQLDSISFCCMLADREKGDLVRSHGSGWKAYEGLSAMALGAVIDDSELVSVLADHVDTPKGVRFEENVREAVNEEKKRLAIATVTRVHSHATDGLQLTDLLLGAAMFDFRQGAMRGRLNEGSQKARLSRYLLERCDVASFRPHGHEIPGKIKVELRRRRRTRRRRRGGDLT